MEYDITASIVLFKNDIVILNNAVKSFLKTEINVKLFLIDNSPSDELKSISSDPRIEYIFNASNLGFGKAHNIAIRKSVIISKYHLVLNPDIYFAEGTLEKLLHFMESNLEVGHVMPKVLYPDGQLQYLCKNNPTPFDLFARRFIPDFLKPIFKRKMDLFEYRDNDYGKIIFDIPYLSGCFMFFRTNTLEKVGLFDEEIFMYIEDADITRRVLQVARTVYYPEATVYHHFEKGSHKSWRLTIYNIQGAIIYFNKWGWF